MVSTDEVIAAYRLILGREPDNDQVVAAHAKQYQSVAELRAAFLRSHEFRLSYPPSAKFRGPASAHRGGRAQRSAWRAEAKKVVEKLAPPTPWFRRLSKTVRPHPEPPDASGDIVFIQTCDPHRYFDMWAAGSQTVRSYCEKNGYAYEAYIGIKNGHFPWHATFNRIFLFGELLEKPFRGWVVYVDADAVIADQAFDLRAYLQDKAGFAAVLSHNGEPHWSNVNIGVVILNYAHPGTSQLIRKYRDLFFSLCQPHLKNAASWGTLPDDQDLFRYVLTENERLVRPGIFLEHADLLNLDPASVTGPHEPSPFINHVLLQSGTIKERTEIIAARAKEILRRSADAENAAAPP